MGGLSGPGDPPKSWLGRMFSSIGSALGFTPEPTMQGGTLKEVVIQGKGTSNSHIIYSKGINVDYGALGSSTNGGLALPQDFGSWNSAGSDGRQWIGCMACHGDNGAYRTLAYNSPSRYTGLSIAATFNAAFSPGGYSSGSDRVTVGQWMTKAEYDTFKASGMIPRSNVLANGSSGFNDINLTHYVEFNVHPNILKLKDANKGWYNVIPNNRMYQKLYQAKGLTMPQPSATNIKLINTIN